MTDPQQSPITKQREAVKQGFAMLTQQALAEGVDQYIAVQRHLAKTSLFYLCLYILGRKDMDNDFVFARCQESQADPWDVLDEWARFHYKDLADDTPMLTANRGWTTHGDLKAGDYVFSPEGRPVRVVGMMNRFTDSECYRITFGDNTSLVAGGEHLWRIRERQRRRIEKTNRRRYEYVDRVVTTKELIGMAGRRDVGVAAPLDFGQENVLPVPPYVLGVWLGDGTSSTGSITGVDDEVFERIRDFGYLVQDTNSITKTVYGLVTELRKIGVLNNKHIPQEYMKGSIRQRMALLRGLMDTDGHCDSRGTATFVNSRKDLADGVFELASGLGLRPHIRQHSFKSNAKKAVEGNYGYWQVSFQAFRDRNVFALSRKADKAIDPTKRRETRLVRTIERIPTVPTSCIKVEGGLYLAGKDLIPTHNTSVGQAQIIQDILNDRNERICVLSYSKVFAEKIIAPIKLEFEQNEKLKALFPDIFYENPKKESPKWSVKEGFTVKRDGNPKEQTVEGYGLVDSLPTGGHYTILHYDDCETEDAVTSGDNIRKLINSWELSLSLVSDNLVTRTRKRYKGTPYHHAGLWAEIVKRKAAKLRCHPATVGGKWPGKSVFLPQDRLEEIYLEMGSRNFNAQMLMNPTPSDTALFQLKYIQNNFWTPNPRGLNIYLFVDPNNLKSDMLESRKRSQKADYCAMWVIGLGADRGYYTLSMERDKFLKGQKIDKVFELVDEWKPICTYYYSGGENSDVDDIRDRQKRDNFRFPIEAIPNNLNKHLLIPELEGMFSQKKFYLPEKMIRTNWQGNRVDLVQEFIYEEFVVYPFGAHDDSLDALSMMRHPKVRGELRFPNRDTGPDRSGGPSDDGDNYDPYGGYDPLEHGL